MEALHYPLEQLLSIKNRRFEKAVTLLEEKKALVLAAEKKLEEIAKERDKVLEHKNDKLRQIREELDKGTTSDKIKQMKAYIDLVKEKLIEAERKIASQQKLLDAAKEQMEIARIEVIKKQREVEKLKIHKQRWQKEANYFLERQDQVEQDDLGSAKFAMLHKRRP